MYQAQDAEAFSLFQEARIFFEQQHEPESVASKWHHIGQVHRLMGQYDKAEAAYRQSLEIKTRINNLAGQARSLNDLGNLYQEDWKRPEEAVVFYRQAIDIAVEMEDLISEGFRRSNIAYVLFSLERYDEARSEIMRAIECKRTFGHAAEIWKSFSILHNIETATGNLEAVQSAWQQARDAYLAYRQQGGYAQSAGGKLVDGVLELIAQGQVDEINSQFGQLMNNSDVPALRKQLPQAVVTIFNGSRDMALADDMALDYSDAAEILFLIERLS